MIFKKRYYTVQKCCCKILLFYQRNIVKE